MEILRNQIRDQIRRAGRRPLTEEVTDTIAGQGPSPYDQAVAEEVLESYETALNDLSERRREAVVSRVELGLTHEQLAQATSHPSANAARMFVARALVRLAELMR